MSMDTLHRVRQFLNRYAMDPNGIDMDACSEKLASEMQRGIEGKPSSLMMLPAYLTAEGRIPDGETALAIDMGGTNMRVALVTFRNSVPEISDFSTYPTPGTRGAVTKEQFLRQVAAYIAPLLPKANKIGFCFSFPAEILPDHDARVEGFNKEVVVSGAENMHLGRELLDYLPEHNQKIVVLNDTVATLLGGLYTGEAMDSDDTIGFILGTGMNACYIEQRENITKIGGGSGSMIVNMEAAGFNGFPLGEFEKRADAESVIPGDHLLEKVVSGAYQGAIVYQTVLQAAKDGLFSETACQRIAGAPAFTSLDLDEFVRHPSGSGVIAALCDSEEDRECMYCLIDCFFERAARLVTMLLAGILKKTGKGKQMHRPVRIVVEGSTFYKSLLFRTKIEYEMKRYLNCRLGRWSRFTQAQDAGLAGAAAAALLNAE